MPVTPDAARGAPGWFRALARTTPAPLQWDRVVLTSIGVAAPVGLGVLLAPQHPAAIGLGSLASMGAMATSVMDLGSAGAERIHRMALVSVTAALGFALGTLVYGNTVATLVAVVAATLVSGLAGTVSATTSRSGLYFLVFAVTAANADFGLANPWEAPVVFFLGAVWRLSLTTVVAAVIGANLAPEKRAVAAVYDAIANQLAASGTPAADAAGSRLTNALNNAYDVMIAARTAVAARDVRWQNLETVLNASAPVVDATIATTTKGLATDPDVVTYVRAVAAWIKDPRATPPAPPSPAGADGPDAERAALASSVRFLARVVERVGSDERRRFVAASRAGLPVGPSVLERLREAGRTLVAGSETWLAILRLVLCMAVAQGVSLVLHLEHPYVVMLTVAQIMKPDLGSVFARAMQRGAGTIIGVVLATIATALIPHDGWQVLAVLALAALIPITMPRNYGLYSGVSVCLAVLLVELHAGASASLIESRLFDTVLGCVVVLAIGYLPWPSTWRAPQLLAQQVADLARGMADYATVALTDSSAARPPNGDGPADPSIPGRAQTTARRQTYRRISDLRTRIVRSLAEPPAISAAAASWTPEITALERVADAVTAAATTTAVSGAELESRDVDRVHGALTDLAAAIADDRAPGADDVPSSGALADVGDEIRSARGALSLRVRQRAHHVRAEA